MLFGEPCLLALESFGFLARMPMELRAKRTVLLRNVDKYIYDLPVGDLLNQLNSKNAWLDIIDVYKIPRSSLLKITCKNCSMVERCLEQGIKISYFHVSPHQISREKFVNVTTCYKCYKLDEHTISSCNKDNAFKICSECSSFDHTYRDCTSSLKKCINCGENHSTLALKCPARK